MFISIVDKLAKVAKFINNSDELRRIIKDARHNIHISAYNITNANNGEQTGQDMARGRIMEQRQKNTQHEFTFEEVMILLSVSAMCLVMLVFLTLLAIMKVAELAANFVANRRRLIEAPENAEDNDHAEHAEYAEYAEDADDYEDQLEVVGAEFCAMFALCIKIVGLVFPILFSLLALWEMIV